MSRKSFVRASILAAALPLVSVPAVADFRVDRELALVPGGRFVLDADSGHVEIRGTDRSGVRVRITSPRDDVEERFELSFEEAADAAVVRLKRRAPRAGSWFSRRSESIRFEVEVPRRADLDVRTAGGGIEAESVEGRAGLRTSGGGLRLEDLQGDVDAHTSGGGIEATDLTGRVRLDTSGGGIRVERVDGNLAAETSGGSIAVRDVTGSVDAETSGGSIEVTEVGGRLRVETSGGPITARFAAGNSQGGSLSTSGGSVRAYVDPAVALDVDASTSGGRVILDLPVTVQGRISRSSVRGTLNGGGASLRLRSSGGSIRLAGR